MKIKTKLFSKKLRNQIISGISVWLFTLAIINTLIIFNLIPNSKLLNDLGASIMPSNDLSCSFESNICSWNNITSDDFDWTINSWPTDTSKTWPISAYEWTYYLYAETSSPNFSKQVSKIAILESNEISVNNDFTLEFNYNMNWAYIWTLKVEVSDNKWDWKELLFRSWNSWDNWIKQKLTLRKNDYNWNIRIRFKVETLKNARWWQWDISIDNIIMSELTTSDVLHTLADTSTSNQTDSTWDIANTGTNYIAQTWTNLSNKTIEIKKWNTLLPKLNPDFYTINDLSEKFDELWLAKYRIIAVDKTNTANSISCIKTTITWRWVKTWCTNTMINEEMSDSILIKVDTNITIDLVLDVQQSLDWLPANLISSSWDQDLKIYWAIWSKDIILNSQNVKMLSNNPEFELSVQWNLTTNTIKAKKICFDDWTCLESAKNLQLNTATNADIDNLTKPTINKIPTIESDDKLTSQLMFSTSTTYNWNLWWIEWADKKCQDIADEVWLDWNYKAMISWSWNRIVKDLINDETRQLVHSLSKQTLHELPTWVWKYSDFYMKQIKMPNNEYDREGAISSWRWTQNFSDNNKWFCKNWTSSGASCTLPSWNINKIVSKSDVPYVNWKETFSDGISANLDTNTYWCASNSDIYVLIGPSTMTNNCNWTLTEKKFVETCDTKQSYWLKVWCQAQYSLTCISNETYRLPIKLAPVVQVQKEDKQSQLMFVTSTEYNGNLWWVIWADTKCQTIASNVWLQWKYKAMIWSSTNRISSLIKDTTRQLVDSYTKKSLSTLPNNEGKYSDYYIDLVLMPNNEYWNKITKAPWRWARWSSELSRSTYDNCNNWTIGNGSYRWLIYNDSKLKYNPIQSSCYFPRLLLCISEEAYDIKIVEEIPIVPTVYAPAQISTWIVTPTTTVQTSTISTAIAISPTETVYTKTSIYNNLWSYKWDFGESICKNWYHLINYNEYIDCLDSKKCKPNVKYWLKSSYGQSCNSYSWSTSYSSYSRNSRGSYWISQDTSIQTCDNFAMVVCVK